MNKCSKEFNIKKGEESEGTINRFLDGIMEKRELLWGGFVYKKSYKVKIEIEEVE